MRFKRHTKRSGGGAASGRLSCTRLLGIDSSVSSPGVSVSRADGTSAFEKHEAPAAVNFIRTGLGEISKRTGFKKVWDFGEITKAYSVINVGAPDKEKIFFFGDNKMINEDESLVFELPAVPERTNSYLCDKYVVTVGGNFVCACDTENGKVEFIFSTGFSNSDTDGIFYTPTVFIGGKPDGAAAAFENVNILNDYVCEQFAGDGKTTDFQVHFDSDGFYKGQILDANGNWYTSNEVSVIGKVLSFKNPPPAPTVTGEDNIRIIYKRKRGDKSKELLKTVCATTVNARFGVNGSGNRIFIAGGKNNKGGIFYSEADNPFYFPESNYIVVGDGNTSVYGLAPIGDALYVICNDGIYTVKGYRNDADETSLYHESAVFRITGYIKTPRPVDVPPVIFDNEVVYMTRDGVCAITPTGVLDERCSQIRSAFVNYFLLKENLSACRLVNCGDFLAITNGSDTVYMLDGKQFEQSAELPFSQRQYEAYIWKLEDVSLMWSVEGKELFYSDGKNVYRQANGNQISDYSDEYRLENGNTVSKSIDAYWETPYIYCSDFAANKFFMRVGILLDGRTAPDGYAINTDLKVYAKFDNDDWRVLKCYDGKRSIFRYAQYDYGRFTYCNKPKSYGTYNRLLHKKARSIRLRFENSNINEPVTLQGFDLEYLQM